MKLEFYNCIQSKNFDTELLPKEVPAFINDEPDWHHLETITEKYAGMKNILVIGHGGSITSFYGFYGALRGQPSEAAVFQLGHKGNGGASGKNGASVRLGASKQAYFLSTTDPDYISELKQRLNPKDTLVLAISKSGETTTQIEALLQFTDYPLLFITDENSPLARIGEKLGAQIIDHPPIGGRFTGFTEVALLPALLCGLDARGIYEGGRSILKLYKEDNPAWQAASVLWQLEQDGYTDVFMPFYSHELFPMSAVIVQLCHESFGKAGKGQTYAAFEAPESQHHTNQRFFGGKKNIAGFFISQEHFHHHLKTQVSAALKDIEIKGRPLATIDGIPLEYSMRAEREGTIEDARQNGIPLIHLLLEQVDESELGQFLAFWQLYAVYSSLLRSVDPFDQPQVEASKIISFKKRLEFKKLI